KTFSQFGPAQNPEEQQKMQAGVAMASGVREQLLKAGAVDWYMIGTMAHANSNSPGFVVATIRPGGDANAVMGVLSLSPQKPFLRTGAVVIGPAGIEAWLAPFQPASREDFVAGFKAAGNTAVQVVLVHSAETRALAGASLPPVPDEAGGSALKILAEK